MRNERQMVFHTVKLGPVMVLFIICNLQFRYIRIIFSISLKDKDKVVIIYLMTPDRRQLEASLRVYALR
jgi:hypothetical protein